MRFGIFWGVNGRIHLHYARDIILRSFMQKMFLHMYVNKRYWVIHKDIYDIVL